MKGHSLSLMPHYERGNGFEAFLKHLLYQMIGKLCQKVESPGQHLFSQGYQCLTMIQREILRDFAT